MYIDALGLSNYRSFGGDVQRIGLAGHRDARGEVGVFEPEFAQAVLLASHHDRERPAQIRGGVERGEPRPLIGRRSHPARLAISRDQPRYLRPAQTRHLTDVEPQ